MRRALCVLLGVACLSGCPTPEERDVSDVSLIFEPGSTESFFSTPWPSDARTIEARRAGGAHPDLWDFPNPNDNDILNEYAVFGSTVIEGFGKNSPTYFWFDGRVELPASERVTARAAGRCEGPVRIVNVDRDSPRFGRCLPARWDRVDEALGDPWLEDDLVRVAPWWGFPLDSGTTYAVVLLDAQDPSGAFLQPPPGLLAQPHLAVLADVLEDTTWVAAATVFTTQDVLSEMHALADFVLTDSDYPAWNEDEGLTLIDEEHPEHDNQYDLYDGAYTAWNFQRGEIPYEAVGGGFVWDDDGRPVPQVAERIPMVVGAPIAAHEQPVEGWPVILHAHGTGGDRWSHLSGGNLRPGLMAAARGFVSVGIPQPFHGDRWPDGNNVAVSLYSFNYFNPESGVSTFRQGALDTIALARFVREAMAEGGAIAEAHPELRIDPDRVYFLGHSQGGLTGGLAIPFAEGIDGWALSGAGGGLSMTIMQREDPFVIRDALLTGIDAPEGTMLDEMHPVVGMVQSLAELTDPINYAPSWVAQSTGEPVSVLLTEGLHDAQTPADTSEALATAGRLPIIADHFERYVDGLRLRDLEVLDDPYGGNLEHPSGVAVTTGVGQFDDDHWAIFNDIEAAALWSNFLYSMATDGAPGELGGSFP